MDQIQTETGSHSKKGNVAHGIKKKKSAMLLIYNLLNPVHFFLRQCNSTPSVLNLSLVLCLSHTHSHTHTHRRVYIQAHNADFTDTDKQCKASYHSSEHSNVEEEEEGDKEAGEDKKMACVSSESQARGACALFQRSVWGEKGDLGCLCLSVLHVLCILSFVMISASAEGGMLASRVQERAGLMG